MSGIDQSLDWWVKNKTSISSWNSCRHITVVRNGDRQRISLKFKVFAWQEYDPFNMTITSVFDNAHREDKAAINN